MPSGYVAQDMQTRSRLKQPPALADWLDQGRVSLFLDFDGTLVDLAPGPDAIRPKDGLASALEALSQRLDGCCAVVSGRAISDIERHVGALSIVVAGSHGAEIRLADGSRSGEPPMSLPPDMERELHAFADAEGLHYEAKPHGGALHYRSTPDKGEAAHAFAEELAKAHGWVALGGKCVVELVAGKADKGTAVRALMVEQPFAESFPVFIGDDLTDERGFAACNALGGASILVGDREPTVANYQLPNVASVHRWLGLWSSA